MILPIIQAQSFADAPQLGGIVAIKKRHVLIRKKADEWLKTNLPLNGFSNKQSLDKKVYYHSYLDVTVFVSSSDSGFTMTVIGNHTDKDFSFFKRLSFEQFHNAWGIALTEEQIKKLNRGHSWDQFYSYFIELFRMQGGTGVNGLKINFKTYIKYQWFIPIYLGSLKIGWLFYPQLIGEYLMGSPAIKSKVLFREYKAAKKRMFFTTAILKSYEQDPAHPPSFNGKSIIQLERIII